MTARSSAYSIYKENASFELQELDPSKKEPDVYWGFRSVYKIK